MLCSSNICHEVKPSVVLLPMTTKCLLQATTQGMSVLIEIILSIVQIMYDECCVLAALIINDWLYSEHSSMAGETDFIACKAERGFLQTSGNAPLQSTPNRFTRWIVVRESGKTMIGPHLLWHQTVFAAVTSDGKQRVA